MQQNMVTLAVTRRLSKTKKKKRICFDIITTKKLSRFHNLHVFTHSARDNSVKFAKK